MPLVHLPEWLSIVLCFILWPVFQVSAAVYCKSLPDRKLNPGLFWFRPHSWEKNGHIYARLLQIRRWKKYLPDGAAVVRSGYRKKTLQDVSPENLNRFLIESCRAELTHLLAIPPFLLFFFLIPPYAVPLMLVYALIVNLPCVLAQRYNRPRVARLLVKKTARQSSALRNG